MLDAYTVLALTYLGKRVARSFMHKCIFYGECIPLGMKKPALAGLKRIVERRLPRQVQVSTMSDMYLVAIWIT